MVITDAKIKQDDITNTANMYTVRQIADICPLGAIEKNSLKKSILRQKNKKYKVDFSLCKKCKNGGICKPLYPAGKPTDLRHCA
jgi:hypothetical protein